MKVGRSPRCVAGVEQPRRPPVLGPGALARERRLVDVPAEHDVGAVGVEQARQLGIAVVARAGPRQRALRRAVERPQPPAGRSTAAASSRASSAASVVGPLPPRRRRSAASRRGRTSRRRRGRRGSRASASQRVAFSPDSVRWSRSWLPEQTSVGHARPRGARGSSGDGDLGVERHRRRDVEQVAGHDDDVDGRRRIAGARPAPSRACAGRSGDRTPAAPARRAVSHAPRTARDGLEPSVSSTG